MPALEFGLLVFALFCGTVGYWWTYYEEGDSAPRQFRAMWLTLVVLLCYLIAQQTGMFLERAALWGAWRDRWQEDGMAWMREVERKLSILATRPPAPERRKWTTPRWGLRP